MKESRKKLMIGYDEIGLKGQNRGDFIRRLIHNISESTGIPQKELEHRQGRIYGSYSTDRESRIFNQLEKIFGIKWFSQAEILPQNYDHLKHAALETADRLREEGRASFKVETRRSNKDFELNSRQINVDLGDDIRVKAGLEVDVHSPDVTFYVEVRENHIYLYTDPHSGPGGLPTGSNGNALMLISGGIDSPVAAWNLMKRGLAVDCVYFHSPPYTGEKALEKVRRLMRVLSEWNVTPMKLYVPYFTNVQERMVEEIPESMWTIAQRRYMHRIADRLVQEQSYLSMATGDSVGQVASQTLENLQLIDRATETLVLRPLTGYDKQEIINLAKQIGTYDISIQPYEDCCTLFAPGSPATRGKRNKLEYAENSLEDQELIDEALERMETETFSVYEDQRKVNEHGDAR